MDDDTRRAIEALDQKYDRKNEKILEKLDKINSNLSQLLEPFGSVQTKADTNSAQIKFLYGLVAALLLALLQLYLGDK